MLLHSKIIGTGQPFLILHGLFGSSDNWYSFSKKISNKFQVHLIDLRNHGRSFQSEKMDNDIMSEDLFHYIKHNNLNNILLMGHSLGGKVAMKFATKFNFYLDKLIIIDICNKSYLLEHDDVINMLDHLDLSCFTSRQEVYNILYDFSKNKLLSQFLVKNLYRMNNNKFQFRFNLNSIKKNINFFGQALKANEVVNIESFFLKGERSDYINPTDITTIKNNFPKSKIIEIKDADHWIHVSNPDLFLVELKKLINY